LLNKQNEVLLLMTTIQLNFNNLSEAEELFSILPASNKYEFTAKRVFRLKHYITCLCEKEMVYNGYNYARKKGFGKVKIGKQICKSCGNRIFTNLRSM
jgi:uncharacterized protein YjaG (DUF416 family)